MLKVLDVVPSWCWAAAVIALGVLCGGLAIGRQSALADASKAQADLLIVQLESAAAITKAQELARLTERRLSTTVLEVQHELSQERAGAAGRIGDLSERLRNAARPVSCRPATGGAPATAGRGDGQRDPGLPGVARADLVVLDGQALSDLSTFAESAADTGRTLTHARRLLRECWRSEPTPDAS